MLNSNSEEISKCKYIIDRLSTENTIVKEQLEGRGGALDVINRLPHIFSSQSKPLSWEIAELFAGRKPQGGAVAPTTLISIADIQKSIHLFSSYYTASIVPLCWQLNNRAGILQAGDPSSTNPLTWNVNNLINGPRCGEIRVLNFENIFSKYLAQRLYNVRVSKDYLRRMEWSIMVWAHSQFSGNLSGKACSSVVDSLPRGMLEHEKSIIKVFSFLFGLPIGEKAIGEVNLFETPKTESILESGTTEIMFLNIYLRCYASLQVQ